MLACWSIIDAHLVRWPIVELILTTACLGSVLYSWRNVAQPSSPDDVDERNLGATVILAQLNGVITGCSIILAGVGAFVALSTKDLGGAAPHLEWAAIWAVMALGLALYTLATLPTRTLKVNFVRSREVAILCAMALLFGLFAAVRFVFAATTFIAG